MSEEIELYCKNGHDPVKVYISGIGGFAPRTILASQEDSNEIRFVYRRCNLVLNTIEMRGNRTIIWNGYIKVGILTYFDEYGNIIKNK